MLINDQGWLVADGGGAPIYHVPSPRHYKLEVPKPIAVVWHYTGGRCGPKYAATLAETIRTYRLGQDRAASWHILIAKDGSVFQSVSCLRGSWHVGKPGQLGERLIDNLNRYTVGVELENSGRVRRAEGLWYCWPYWKDPHATERVPSAKYRVEAKRVVQVPTSGYFDSFPEEQIRSACHVAAALAAAYQLDRQALSYGHMDFDPGRKEDPGPLWRGTIQTRVLAAAV